MKRILLLSLLAVLVPADVFARGGKLSTLTVGFPEGATPEARAKVITYLKEQFTLIEGSFINRYTTQSFSGSTSKLNELIQLLSSSQFELLVVFADLKDDRVIFAFSQNAGGAGDSTITINTTSKDFNWSELNIRISPAKLNIQPKASDKRPGSDERKE